MVSFSRNLLWITCILCLFFKTGFSAPVEEDDYANDDDDYANDDEESNGEEDSGPPPAIKNKGRDLDVHAGRDVFLPCETVNTDNVAVLWYHDMSTLFVDSTKMTPEKRLSIFPNSTLAIRNAQPSDTGRYKCQISVEPPVEIVYTLTISLPARITKRVPEETQKIIEKGSALTLACEAEGIPEPVITWTRKNGKTFLNGNREMTGSSLTFENVDRHYAGVYMCTAKNVQGEDTATFNIHIHYAPEIEIAEETITTTIALEPEITCTVHADPAPTVSWYRGGLALQNNDHIQLKTNGNKHTLLIKGMQKSDFGSYTCHAKNKLGSAKKTVAISGAPSRPQIKVSYTDTKAQLPQIKWNVESHLPIQKYEIFYKTVDSQNKTIEETKSEREGNIYSGTTVLQDIVPGESNVLIRARNDLGWSEPANFKVTSGDSLIVQALTAMEESSSATRAVGISLIVAVCSLMRLLV